MTGWISLILFVFVFLPGGVAEAAPPRLVLAAGEGGWRDPQYSPDGKLIAFASSDQSRILVLEQGRKEPATVARGEKIGRRFVFEPGKERIVFRLRINALPQRPERLLSTSVYLYDPVHLTSNAAGDIFGPYVIRGAVHYRLSLVGPYFDTEGHVRTAGPCWDTESGRLWVLNAELDTVFASAINARIAGVEISPDGQWVAAVQSQPQRRLLIVHVDDGQTISVERAWAPNWAASLPSLICVAEHESGTHELRTVSLPAGTQTVVFSDPRVRPETPALSANGTRALFVHGGAIYEIEIP